MSILKFESMLKTNDVYFFDAVEFETIIEHYLNIAKNSLAKKAVALGLEQHPSSIQLKLMKVELLVFDNELKEATQLLKNIEAVEPYNDEVFIQKALILSKKELHIEAIAVLKESLSFIEDPADIWSMLGMEYLYLDDYKNARLNFEKCVAFDAEDFSSLYNIVYCFDAEERHIEAIQFLNTYIDKNPYCEVAWHQLGRKYAEIGMYREALTAFEYSVLIDETFIAGYLEMAKTLEDLNRYEEAIKNYKITLELDDPTAFSYIRIGECYEKLENVNAAIHFYKKAVAQDPSLDKAWILLTTICFEDQNYQKALYYVKKAIKIDEINPFYWRIYSDISLKLNFYEEAVKGLYTCIELGDDEMEVYTDLADILLFLGEFDEALKTLIKAKKLYEDFAEIEYRLCGLFMILDKQAYGLTHLKNALAINFELHDIINELYPTVFEHEKVQEMVSDYKKALK
ncbi:tetratricopeptide repeat protein [Tenacibaculum finnmarkense genomovar ulcerans]|uniref:tetratricopeptide repeat protein n=2 Tax=Tenacibaculum finnmarkense TaxID=2781243 RepID=UPI00187BAD99|nr:tetratricopeptide repeat protein [Tenacibaculum finnmarkense]MBE7692344.1 tetratricopeptide repeat protein [Tenacibaculum finnmarkense genomovar finnmarkense]MCD8412509.1 tetratricopeptide repeat protein [Tenacibaculum finnmarkense genomovar ulcerans]MCD8432083.1 tetratricopeptide repeat protein [Tenacibaculum finnmarkense genomovar ulcerans]MCG8750157.1 tetratricopeptide repeat protein [Tenacibaculum finnmarkense]MCG8754279.1 tetratricopeptide repeat protein [Tenacibaculum finnmarkense]